ncbi:MAG: glycoside hydrolase family 113 [Candidatus Heimdallarchaeaceae archaeon]
MKINFRVLITLLIAILFLSFFVSIRLEPKESQGKGTIYIPYELIEKNQSSKKEIPLVTFIYDDGYSTDYSVMKPVFDSQGEVACSAVISDWLDCPDFLTTAQLTILYNAGWEVLDHTCNHPNLTELTEEQIRAQFTDSISSLEGKGYIVKNLVYPYHGHNELVRRLAEEYFRSARGTIGINPHTLDIYALSSYSIDDPMDLASYKSYVDIAEREKKWLIFFAHKTDTSDARVTNDLIDYIQEKNIDIVTVDQALDLIGNMVDIGKKAEITTSKTRINLNPLSFKGMDYFPSPSAYDTGEAFGSLENLLKIEEINYVQLRFFLDQKGIDSSIVSFDIKQDKTLIRMIKQVHKSGKKVSLLPHLIIESGEYVANIEPQDKDLWFFCYQSSLIHYVLLAQENGVELFALGNEMHSLWGYEDNWKNMIDNIREIYNGLITVKLNCWWQEKTFQKVMSWDWLSDLDYISIAPYFDLTWENDLSLEELREAWQNSRHRLNIVKELEEIAKKHKKKMIFSEMGYRSIDGTTIEPWNGDSIVPRSGGSGKIDLEEQSIATQALFDVFKDKDWWAGVFWFYWPTLKPTSEDKTWAIWSKPVQLVIQNNFCNKGGGLIFPFIFFINIKYFII